MTSEPLRVALVLAACLTACVQPSDGEVDDSPGEDAAGDGDGDGHAQPSTYTYWRDAKAVLDAKCIGCHVDGDIAPFALGSYAEVAAVATILPSAIESGVMPPWPPGEGCNEYRHDRSLTDAEQELLLTWLAEGAPEGDPADEPASGDGDPAPVFTPNVTLTMPEAFTPTQEPDEYRCFVIPWAGEAPYVTGYRVVPGQRSIVHHVIAFAVDPAQVDQVEQLDAADEGAGYSCFGDSGVPEARWIGSWAPGGDAFVFPEGTGVRVDPGSRVVIQVHYNTSVSAPIADASSIELSLADQVERPLVNQPATNPGWVLGFEPMTIPAGEAEVTHMTELDLHASPWSGFLAETGVSAGEDLLLHTAALHMHQLGVRAKLTLIRAESDQECMLEIPEWDFGWQGGYRFIEPIHIHPGDKLGLQCWWDNSAANQPIIGGQLLDPIDVAWGEGTRDEMCLAVLSLTRP